MILVDAGPLVALFDPKDGEHLRCRDVLRGLEEPLRTTADHEIDLTDASLVTTVEALGTPTVFTIDRNDFATYRVRRGHRHYAFRIV